MGEEISKRLRTPVLAINRPGAGGAVAAASVVQAKKDGQTILFAQNSALTFRVVLDPQSASYDPRRDLVPLGIASRTPSVLVGAQRRALQKLRGACRLREEESRPGAHRPPGRGIGR